MEKKIHYCWFGGKKLPKKVKKCIETWKKFLPDYEIIEWNESNFDINMCEFVKQAYANKKWAFVSDYVRIFALYNEGGIYFDTDMKITKDISDIVKNDMFLGYEDSGYIGTAVIGVSEKNNKYVKEILDYYNNIKEFNCEIIYNYANPIIISKILKKYNKIENDDGITVIDNNIYIYPRDYFYPLSYNFQEQVFTKNTCMVHLFNATWTDKKERRTINLYRKLGPNWGRRINKIFEFTANKRNGLKMFIIKIIKSIRLKLSIYLNRNKRVNNIKEELNKIESNYIIIANPDNDYEVNNINELFKGNILYIRKQYTQKEASLIAKEIVESGKKIVAFNSMESGWDRIIDEINQIDKSIKIKAIMNYDKTRWIQGDIWEKYIKIMDLYNKKKINSIAVFNIEDYKYLLKKGYNVSLLKKLFKVNENSNNIEKNNSTVKIGIYEAYDNQIKNIYNQLEACSLIDNHFIDINPLNEKIKMFSKLNNINITGTSNYLNTNELIERIKLNSINVFLNLADDNSIIPLVSLENGIPCLISNYSYIDDNKLKSLIECKNVENIEEIKEKIIEIINNRSLILKEYDIFRETYIKDCLEKKNEFLEI